MKRILKILVLGILSLLSSTVCFGQVPPFSDQFLVNPFLINPALAGTSRQAPLSLSVRQQWMGIKTAPVYQTLSFHKSMINKGERFNPQGFLNRGDNSYGKVGLGGGLFNLSYGSVSQFGAHADYAYHVYLNKGRLSFGLSTIYQQLTINTPNFIRPDGSIFDNLLDPANREVTHFVDAGAGIHYFSQSFFAGVSVLQLFNSTVKFGDMNFKALEDPSNNEYLARTFYGYGGLTHSIGKNLVLKPSLVLKYSQVGGIAFQLNAAASFYQNFEAGLLYRYNQSIGFYLGIQAGNVLIRYQFESPTGTAAGMRFLSNQVLVGYLF